MFGKNRLLPSSIFIISLFIALINICRTLHLVHWISEYGMSLIYFGAASITALLIKNYILN